jgi:hyaluronoglucosaminidase
MTMDLGTIEGFFGRPYSWAERTDLMRLLKPHGYDFYLYAPKADPYLRRRWREPHPDTETAALAAFAADCRATDVRFGVGLSPFELHFDFTTEAKADLAEIVAFAAERSAAGRLIVCPSYYTDDTVLDRVFGPRPAGYLRDLGAALDPAIDIMWTGEEVCSLEISPGHLARVTEELGRKPFLWDNYPVNDGPRMSRHLHLRAFTGRPAANAGYLRGHAVNPASQPTLSAIPMLSLAASYAQGQDYAYGQAFQAAARQVCGEALAARLTADLLTLQDGGLDEISDERRVKLQDRYAAFDHPAAREVVAWLEGAYAVTGEELQTQ